MPRPATGDRMSFDITSPGALLQALDQGARGAKLPPALSELVTHALREPRRWGLLVAASRGLRVWQRILEEDGLPVSSNITEALVKIRGAMAELRKAGRP